jgi:hypothetical protein
VPSPTIVEDQTVGLSLAALWTRLTGLAIALCLWTGPALALDQGQIRLGADYDIFTIGGEDHRPCEQACREDPKCKSWTFLKTLGQCRLKHSVAPAFPNACCVSDVKRERPNVATDEVLCADSAVAAVDAYDLNLVNRCGFTGPLWTSDYRALYRQCLRNSPTRRDAETRERAAALEDCRAIALRGQELRCDHYVRVTIQQLRTATVNRCGFSEGVWSSSAAQLANECKRLSVGDIANGVSQREQRLARCIARGGGAVDAACRSYAERSVAQFRRGVASRCGAGFSGNAFWHDDAERHYLWCVAARPPERAKWIADRDRGLERCDEERRKGFKFILRF